jgi:hypothetical protein
MSLLVSLLGLAGLCGVIVMLVILARLTQRWESVTHTHSRYRFFYVSAGLLGLSLIARLLRTIDIASDLEVSIFSAPTSWLYVSLYHLPLAIGVTISLAVSWRNWGWLLRERGN